VKNVVGSSATLSGFANQSFATLAILWTFREDPMVSHSYARSLGTERVVVRL
jgi:hypothetical protein